MKFIEDDKYYLAECLLENVKENLVIDGGDSNLKNHETVLK